MLGSSDLPPLPDTPVGRYRHDKGGECEVIGVARHGETREALVVDGVRRPRFQRIDAG